MLHFTIVSDLFSEKYPNNNYFIWQKERSGILLNDTND